VSPAQVINEPWAGNIFADPRLLLSQRGDKVNLQPMYERVAAGIRQIDATRNIFFEKNLGNALLNSGFSQVPGGAAYADRSVYSYHDCERTW
jgi:endoglycosylceramidase